MIDGLMDSLVLDKLPTRENIAGQLAELCRAAEDLDPILKSFKNDQQLCVGVRDILGKDDVQATTGRFRTLPRSASAESPIASSGTWRPASGRRPEAPAREP